MIQLHALVFLTVLELLVVFIALWVMWIFKTRKLTSQLAAAQAGPAAPKPEANAAAYFATELLITQERLERQAEDVPSAVAALKLRSAYLGLERELAQGQQRDPAFWEQAQNRIAALLEQYAPAAPETPLAAGAKPVDAGAAENTFQQTDEEEAVRVKRLFDAQSVIINEVKTAMSALTGDDADIQSLLTKLDRISHTNREMSMCVSILEDDNTFLREQIAALLKME